MLSNPLNFNGNDSITVALPTIVPTAWLISSGAGNDTISISGGAQALSVNAGSGNDIIYAKDFGHKIDGGSGTDVVVFSGVKSAHSITKSGTSLIVKNSTNVNSETLTNVERIKFDDLVFATDIDGTAGQAYRIYQAAFNRSPDQAGLGYWIGVMDAGASLAEVASGFVGSQEFKATFGSNPSNIEIVTRFYQNVLHRAPDQGGLDYWVGILNSKAASVSAVLAGFSESTENKAGLIGIIGNGFSYLPYGN